MTKVDLVIFTDASPATGHGHVMRAIALFDAANEMGLIAKLDCDNEYTTKLLTFYGHKKHLIEPSENIQTSVIIYDQKEDLNEGIVSAKRREGAQVVILDELGKSRASADFVIDAMMTDDRATNLLHSDNTTYLYGLNFAIIRPAFRMIHDKGMIISDANKPMICFGGSDPNETSRRFLQQLDAMGFRGPVIIVSSDSGLSEVCAAWEGVEIFDQVKEMAPLIERSSFLVTKLGILVLEAFSLGRPCIEINPTSLHSSLSSKLFEHYDGWPSSNHGQIENAAVHGAALQFIQWIENPYLYREKCYRAFDLVDGKGAQRILENIFHR